MEKFLIFRVDHRTVRPFRRPPEPQGALGLSGARAVTLFSTDEDYRCGPGHGIEREINIFAVRLDSKSWRKMSSRSAAIRLVRMQSTLSRSVGHEKSRSRSIFAGLELVNHLSLPWRTVSAAKVERPLWVSKAVSGSRRRRLLGQTLGRSRYHPSRHPLLVLLDTFSPEWSIPVFDHGINGGSHVGRYVLEY